MRHCYYLSSTYRKGAEVQTPERNPSQGYSKLATDLKSNLRLYSKAVITLSWGSEKPSLLSRKRGKSDDLISNITLSPSLPSKRAENIPGTGFVVVQSLSCVQLFVTPWTAAHLASLSTTNSRSLLRLTSIELVMPSSHLILCCHLLLPPSISLSIRVFSNERVLHIRWPNYWSFSFSISPSNDYSGLISFRIDWFNLLAVQGTLKSLLQHHSSSILLCSAFFTVQLSHPYVTTGKTIALTRWNFISKVMSLLF